MTDSGMKQLVLFKLRDLNLDMELANYIDLIEDCKEKIESMEMD